MRHIPSHFVMLLGWIEITQILDMSLLNRFLGFML